MINKEVRELLEKANDNLDKAYKSFRIAISDMRDDEGVNKELKAILIEIDQAKRKLEHLLYPISDVEIFKLVTSDKTWFFSKANH